MNIKKLLLFSLLIIIIPFIIVSLFISDDEIKFNYTSNQKVRVFRESTGNIETVPLEKYVYLVVASEMPASFEEEALKAQAVASRTYVMYQINKNKDKDYDVYDSVNSQVYNTEDKLKEKWQDRYIDYSNKIKKVVLDTLGKYIVYNDEIIEAFFFSTSVGYTENSETVFNEKLPYLRSVESSWDKDSPAFSDERVYSKEEFCTLLNIDCNSINIEILSKTVTGRIDKLKINNKEFRGVDIRSILGLRSSYFEIINDNNITIKTKGYGHGVGMSQYGANGMAKLGYSYEDIIKHYYTNVRIKKL